MFENETGPDIKNLFHASELATIRSWKEFAKRWGYGTGKGKYEEDVHESRDYFYITAVSDIVFRITDHLCNYNKVIKTDVWQKAVQTQQTLTELKNGHLDHCTELQEFFEECPEFANILRGLDLSESTQHFQVIGHAGKCLVHWAQKNKRGMLSELRALDILAKQYKAYVEASYSATEEEDERAQEEHDAKMMAEEAEKEADVKKRSRDDASEEDDRPHKRVFSDTHAKPFRCLTQRYCKNTVA